MYIYILHTYVDVNIYRHPHTHADSTSPAFCKCQNKYRLELREVHLKEVHVCACTRHTVPIRTTATLHEDLSALKRS